MYIPNKLINIANVKMFKFYLSKDFILLSIFVERC